MERRPSRWIASLLAAAIVLLVPGPEAYAQVGRIAAPETGASAAPRLALPNAGVSALGAPGALLAAPALAPGLGALSAAS
ncbi:MAG: hypothetical protein HY079_14110, partial [Elusimicrobia bacterium]|nr:hypothetical protein [Elusimicrobiota bacterium]